MLGAFDAAYIFVSGFTVFFCECACSDACEGDRKGQRLIGMTILKKVTAKGNGAYQGKEILDPFSGKTYRVKLKLKETNQVLEVRGFVGLSLFGRTQLWKRVNDGE